MSSEPPIGNSHSRLCQKRDCPNEGTLAIKICVPVLGSAEMDLQAASILVGVRLCPEHMEQDDPQGWVGGEDGKVFRSLLAMNAPGVPLDFDRAYTVGVSIHSPEYQDLLAKRPN